MLSSFRTTPLLDGRLASEVSLRYFCGTDTFFRVTITPAPLVAANGEIHCPQSDVYDFGDAHLARTLFYALFDADVEHRAIIAAPPPVISTQSFVPMPTPEERANRDQMISPEIYRARLEECLARRHAQSQVGTEFESDAARRYLEL
jgi:hypothetical protein